MSLTDDWLQQATKQASRIASRRAALEADLRALEDTGPEALEVEIAALDAELARLVARREGLQEALSASIAAELEGLRAACALLVERLPEGVDDTGWVAWLGEWFLREGRTWEPNLLDLGGSGIAPAARDAWDRLVVPLLVTPAETEAVPTTPADLGALDDRRTRLRARVEEQAAVFGQAGRDLCALVAGLGPQNLALTSEVVVRLEKHLRPFAEAATLESDMLVALR